MIVAPRPSPPPSASRRADLPRTSRAIAASCLAIALAVTACDSSSSGAKGEAAPAAPAKVESPTAKALPPTEASADQTKAQKPEADDETGAPPTADPAVAHEISATRALVLQGDALVRLAPSGKTETIVAAPKVESCQVDDDYRVVWLVSDTEVFAWDLEDPGLKKVAKGFVAPDDGVRWQVQRADPPSPFNATTAGNADGLDDCLALVIEMGADPGIRGEVVAEGDREWYCVEEGTIGSDHPKLQPEQAAIDAGYDKAKLADRALLVALETRRKDKGKRARPELKPPPAPTVAIDEAQCEENPEACGTTEYIGGGRLWWVVTANSRGDFFHETRQIYDSKTSTFWDPEADARDAKPGEGEEAVQLHASPDGTWGIYEDKILALAEAKATGTVVGSFCGWE